MTETNYVRRLMEGPCDDPKARIIAAAIEEVAHRSIEGARTREIARIAGVNLAAINYYFGSKDALYLELVREIAEMIYAFHTDHFARAHEIFEKKDAKAAKALLLDLMFSYIGESSRNLLFSNITLIVYKEEMFPGKAFDILYQTAFKKITETNVRLVETASEGRITGERASLLTSMLFGQVRIFRSCMTGIMRFNKWKQIGPAEKERIRAVFAENIEKILKR